MYIYSFFAVFLFRLRAWCPLCTQIKRFKRVLLSECAVISPLRLKSICVRTQIAKTEYLPAEYIPLAFLTRTPSPYSAGWRWGLLSRKIFFIFWIHYQLVLIILRFLFFLIFARNIVNGFLPWIVFLVLYSFDYDLEFTSYRLELWLLYNFSISYFRFWISTRFSIADSML